MSASTCPRMMFEHLNSEVWISTPDLLHLIPRRFTNYPWTYVPKQYTTYREYIEYLRSNPTPDTINFGIEGVDDDDILLNIIENDQARILNIPTYLERYADQIESHNYDNLRFFYFDFFDMDDPSFISKHDEFIEITPETFEGLLVDENCLVNPGLFGYQKKTIQKAIMDTIGAPKNPTREERRKYRRKVMDIAAKYKLGLYNQRGERIDHNFLNFHEETLVNIYRHLSQSEMKKDPNVIALFRQDLVENGFSLYKNAAWKREVRVELTRDMPLVVEEFKHGNPNSQWVMRDRTTFGAFEGEITTQEQEPNLCRSEAMTSNKDLIIYAFEADIADIFYDWRETDLSELCDRIDKYLALTRRYRGNIFE